MPKLSFTNEERARYFNGQLKHKAYKETVDMAQHLSYHAEGEYPRKMIEERRPSESKAVLDYRKTIWKPITKPIWSKVITELNKIRRSSEWSIKYDDSKVPPKIVPEETLKKYCEENYPFFNSVTNWVFKILLPGYCKDANAVVAVMPADRYSEPNEYIRPFGHFYGSDCVIDYVQDDYAVIKSTDKVIYTNEQGAKYFGDVYYIFTTVSIERWEQGNGTLRYTLAWEHIHNLNKLPVFRVEGLYKKSYDNTFIFDSRLNSMLPRLDEALREYGDLQAEVVQNIYSTMWEMASDDCSACRGKGKTKSAGFMGEEITCHVCEGTGFKPRGPFTNLKVRMPEAGTTTPVPIPPAGYIQKSTEIVKIQDERIEKHEYKALSAINMEYLSEAPLNQSGTAKEVDKDALNNFVHAIAEDIVASMDKLYMLICDYRYSFQIPDAATRKGLLPFINVPEKFDLLSSTYLEDQISKQKTDKGNPAIIKAMEEDYVNKKFVGDNALRERVLLSIRLDPLAGISEEDKMTRLSNKGITDETYIISCNMQKFINRAIFEKGDSFFTMKLNDQEALLVQYATEQLTAGSAAASILDIQPGEVGAAGGNKLKDSVGGLTGMIDIAKAVGSGVLDLEAAVAIVADRFGLSEEEARKQLGTPNIPDSPEKIEKVAKLT